MMSITIYDGTNTIGGNKIYIEEKGKGIFLDFGYNFAKYGLYYQEFLRDRSSRGIHDLILLNLIPKLNIYRPDLIPSDINLTSFPSLDIEAVLLSHAHMDHFGNIGLLDTKIPTIASPTSLAIMKCILDSSFANLSNQVVYYSEKKKHANDRVLIAKGGDDKSRDFISTTDYSDEFEKFLSMPVKGYKKIQKGKLSKLENFSSQFEIKDFEVDHSIYGATAYIISSDTSIAYTGDFRLHGKKAEDSKKFINKAKDASILITEGTRVSREEKEVINESEEIVFNNCLKVIEESKDIVIANFPGRNIERFETFQAIANKTGRQIVIPAKIAYLLNALSYIDGENRMKNTLVFNDLKARTRKWEEVILKRRKHIKYIDSLDIAKEPENYLLCFSFYDMKQLLDIKLSKGDYVYSSSEAFDEESELDFVRFYNWLKFFKFNVHGFKIVEEKGRLKPEFKPGFHASGHVSMADLRQVIYTIDPDVIIPVHTTNPGWFDKEFDNAVILKDGETHRI